MLHFRQLSSNVGEPLILLHGLFGSLENLAGIGRQLAEQFDVYLLDLPNHGRSDHVSYDSLSDYAEAIALWLEQHAIQHPMILGHSLGGKIAMELAVLRPERVNKLVVLDISPVRYPDRHSKVFEGLNAIPLKDLSSRTDADRVLQEFVPELAIRTFLLKNLQREGQGFVWRMNLTELEKSYLSLIAANSGGVFNGPVLFLKGGDSDYILKEYQAETVSRFPRAQLRIVANTAHWLHAENPTLVARLVARFLSPESD